MKEKKRREKEKGGKKVYAGRHVWEASVRPWRPVHEDLCFSALRCIPSGLGNVHVRTRLTYQDVNWCDHISLEP